MPAAVDVLPRHRRQGLGRCGVDAAAASREIYRRDLGAQGFRVVLLEYTLVVSTALATVMGGQQVCIQTCRLCNDGGVTVTIQ